MALNIKNHEKIVENDGITKVTTVVQPHEGKLYSHVEAANRKPVLELNQRLRSSLSGTGRKMRFILQIPEQDYIQASKRYDLHKGSMEDRRREAERLARDHPEWVAYVRDDRVLRRHP